MAGSPSRTFTMTSSITRRRMTTGPTWTTSKFPSLLLSSHAGLLQDLTLYSPCLSSYQPRTQSPRRY